MREIMLSFSEEHGITVSDQMGGKGHNHVSPKSR